MIASVGGFGCDSSEVHSPDTVATLNATLLAGHWQGLMASVTGAPDTMRLDLSATSTVGGAPITVVGTAVWTFIGTPLPYAVDGVATGSRVTLNLTQQTGLLPPSMLPPDKLVLDGMKNSDGVQLTGLFVTGPFAKSISLTRVSQ